MRLNPGLLVLGGNGIGGIRLGGWGRWVAGRSDLETREEFAAFGIPKVIHGLGDFHDLAVPTIFVDHSLPDDELDFVVVALRRYIFSTGQVKRRGHLIKGHPEKLAPDGTRDGSKTVCSADSTST